MSVRGDQEGEKEDKSVNTKKRRSQEFQRGDRRHGIEEDGHHPLTWEWGIIGYKGVPEMP